jgi:hypothetical protein
MPAHRRKGPQRPIAVARAPLVWRRRSDICGPLGRRRRRWRHRVLEELLPKAKSREKPAGLQGGAGFKGGRIQRSRNLRPTVATVRREHVEMFPDAGPQEEGTAAADRRCTRSAGRAPKERAAPAQMRPAGAPPPAAPLHARPSGAAGGALCRLSATFAHPNAYPYTNYGAIVAGHLSNK